MARLLMIHGLGDDATAWDTTIGCLDERHDSLAVNVPGFGGREFNGQSLEQVAQLFVDEYVGEVPTVVVGHSMGGVLATLMAAISSNDAVGGVVNIEGNLTQPDAYFSGKAASSENFDSWFRLFRAKWPGRYGLALDRCQPQALRSCAADLVRLSANDDIGRRYLSLTVPKLYVMGTTSMTDTSLELLQRCESVQFDGGHWVMEEHPAEVAAAIEQWLQRQGL